jgi:eukaryotic-like serine/threonine-protein kinase
MLDLTSRAQPTQLGPYTILGTIARGGMGVVYRARHAESGDEAAVKSVMAPGAEVLEGIRREIHVLSRLSHPGVVRIVAQGLKDAVPWYAMELLDGMPLDAFNREIWRNARLARVASMADQMTLVGVVHEGAEPPLPPSGPSPTPVRNGVLARGDTADWDDVVNGGPGADGEARGLSHPSIIEPPRLVTSAAGRPPAAAGKLVEILSLVHEICAPLAFLHGEGVVHRDLKPENVVLRARDGAPVLIDFGVVSEFGASRSREVLDVGGLPQGTAGYMAPEQIRGEYVDARTDLYALGCILYELVAGRLPFVGGLVSVLQAHMGEPPPGLSTWVSSVPSGLDALVMRLLAKDPRERFGHAADVARALRGLGAAPGATDVTSAAPRSYLYRPGFSGREAVVGEILELLGRVRQGGGCVLVKAESGMGKTRLVMEVARQARRKGVVVVTGECLPFLGGSGEASGPALHPLRGLLQALADQAAAKGEQYAHSVIGAKGKLLAHYEAALGSLPGFDVYPEPPPLPSNAARERLLQVLQETLIDFAGGAPVLLILDDLQWADELTMELLLSLRPEFYARCPVLVLGTLRADEVTPGLGELAAADGVKTFELEPLDARSCSSMVSEMLALTTPPSVLVELLVEHASGNPFFVAEYLRAAVGEGLLSRDAAGKWELSARGEGFSAGRAAWSAGQERAAPGGYPASGSAAGVGGPSSHPGLPLPGSLRELSQRRVASLGDDARALLGVAAVAGGEVHGDVLAQAARGVLADERFLSALDELIAKQLLAQAPGGQFRFAHDSFRITVYEALPAARRVELHRELAVRLDAWLTEDRRPLYNALLAHHWILSGELARGVRCLELAGEHALSTGAYRETLGLLERAVALDARLRAAASAGGAGARGSDGDSRENRLRRARWARLLAEANLRLGRRPEGLRRANEALSLLERGFPVSSGQLAVGLIGQIGEQLGHRLLRRGDAAGAPLDGEVSLEAARVCQELSAVYYHSDDTARSVYAALRALNLSERAGAPSAELVRAYGSLCVLTGVLPPYTLADVYARLARTSARQVGDRHAEAWVWTTIGLSHLGVGRWANAEHALTKASGLYRELGDVRLWEESSSVLAFSLCAQGELRRSQALWLEVGASAERRGDVQILTWSLCGRSETGLRLGEVSQAISLLEQAHKILSENIERANEIRALGLLASARWRAGQRGAALECAERCADRIRQTLPSAVAALDGYAGVAEVFLSACEEPGGGRAEHEAAARQACRSLGQFSLSFPIGKPRLLQFEARLVALSGNAGRAAAAWRRAAAAAHKLDMPFDEAVALEALGRCPASGDEGPELVDQAELLFDRLGVPRSVG